MGEGMFSLQIRRGFRSMSDDSHPAGDSAADDFVQQLAQCQLRLQLYIVAVVGNAVDAEDVRQNTNTVMWRKRGEFQPGSNFLAWAYRIAQFEVLKHRERRRKEMPQLSPEVIALLGEDALEDADLLEQRRDALAGCLQKLERSDRDLVQAVYHGGKTLAAVAEQIGRSASSVRHSISRVRRQLRACIESTLAQEGQP